MGSLQLYAFAIQMILLILQFGWLDQVWQLLCTGKSTSCPLTLRGCQKCKFLLGSGCFPLVLRHLSRVIAFQWFESWLSSFQRQVTTQPLDFACWRQPDSHPAKGERLQIHSTWAPILNTCMIKPSGLGRYNGALCAQADVFFPDYAVCF